MIVNGMYEIWENFFLESEWKGGESIMYLF